MKTLVQPHGGSLQDNWIEESNIPQILEKFQGQHSIVVDDREAADIELLGSGAVSPLTGFVGQDDYLSIVTTMRLTDGTVWPMPITLAITEDQAPQLRGRDSVMLTDKQGNPLALLDIDNIFPADKEREALHVFGTQDTSHPGVSYLKSRGNLYVAGRLHVFPLRHDLPFRSFRLTPRQLREEITARGWSRVAGFQTRNPIHRAHEHLTKLALEFTDGLVIHPLVGETKSDDVPAATRFESYQAIIREYFPKDRVILSVFPAAMRYAGPREALFHALVRKNYGISHMIVGRDHAGVGQFYKPMAAQEIFDQFSPEELGVTPLRFEPTYYCQKCMNPASSRTCPHASEHHVALSGTKVRDLLSKGQSLPPEFSRPEVVSVLKTFYQGQTDVRSGTSSLYKAQRGFILWFTGLSGAGKSTLTHAFKERLSSDTRVEVLDGDEVRLHLTKGLGFSKEDRDENIRRIGYVATLLARNDVVTIVAAISPYAAVRNEIRDKAHAQGIPFIEVFVNAKLDTLIERDVKGLYKKALSGEIKNFTGVSDPYEAPLQPDIEVNSSTQATHVSLDHIAKILIERGLITAQDT